MKPPEGLRGRQERGKKVFVRGERMDAREYRRNLRRANELPLLYVVMAFQFACMLLLAFRDGAPDAFSLRMSVFLPAGTYFGLKLLSRLWPIDRAVYIQVAFLGSLSVILLRAVFRKTDNAADQATYLLVSLAPMLFGVWIVRALKRHEGFCAALMPLSPLAFMAVDTCGFHSATVER